MGGVLLEGSDTCSAALQNVIFALTLYPEVKKRAAEELDRVVGADRAPAWEDIPSLPYTLALIEEVSEFCRRELYDCRTFSSGQSVPARRSLRPSSCYDKRRCARRSSLS